MPLYYHFTSLDTLLKIIEGKSWRFTNIGYMNDGNEFHYAWEMAKELAPEIADTSLRAEILPYWVSCFSELEDSFSQWGLYGNGGSGIAIGIDVVKLKDSLDRPPFLFDATHIVYDITTQRQRIEKATARFRESFGVDGRETSLLGAIGELGVFFKQEQFSSEREVRAYQFYPFFEREDLAKPPEETPNFPATSAKFLRFTNRSGVLIPYLELPITDMHLIKRVVLGPKISKGNNFRFLKNLLWQKGLEHIEIAISNIASGV